MRPSSALVAAIASIRLFESGAVLSANFTAWEIVIRSPLFAIKERIPSSIAKSVLKSDIHNFLHFRLFFTAGLVTGVILRGGAFCLFVLSSDWASRSCNVFCFSYFLTLLLYYSVTISSATLNNSSRADKSRACQPSKAAC